MLGDMADRVTAQQFHEADGAGDWRVLFTGASAHFRIGSYEDGTEFVAAIGRLASDADRRPDVDVREAAVIVTLAHGADGLSYRDVELARQISAAARERRLAADPAAVQSVHLTIDALVGPEVMPFWRAVLGYEQVGDEDLLDPLWRGPSIWFQAMDARRPQRNRIHVDVSVPHDQAEGRINAALAAGGRLVSDEHAPAWWTLADAEDNEVDVATVMGRD